MSIVLSLDSLYQVNWVVYCRKPFKSAQQVLNYLGRYTHRVAISNSRIVDFDGENVTFKWKDYKDNYRIKLMTISAAEFVRRFLLHVLPTGFTKIRHYGILASCNVKFKLALCFKLAGTITVAPPTVVNTNSCPICGGIMGFAGLISNVSSRVLITAALGP